MSSIYPQSTSLTVTHFRISPPKTKWDIQKTYKSSSDQTPIPKATSFWETSKQPKILPFSKVPLSNQDLQINAVLTAAKGHALQHPKNILPSRKYLPLEDTENCDISDFLDESVSFIADQLRTTNVNVCWFRFLFIAYPEWDVQQLW